MLQMLRKRLNKKDEGFTLIELMVVVLIIAILLAIAIPTFLGARSRAQNRAAESNLRNALSAEKTVFTDNQSYVSASVVQTAEPSLSFVVATPTKGSNQVVVLPETDTVGGVSTPGTTLCAWNQAASGNFYGIMDASVAGSTYASAGTFFYEGTAAPSCSSETGWSASTSAAGW